MEPKKTFVFYLSWRSAINLLNDSQKAELLNAIFDYVSGEPVFINDGGVNICFEFIKSDIERDLEKWENIKEKRREAGKKGGMYSKKNNPVVFSETQNNPLGFKLINQTKQKEAKEANACFAKQKEAKEANACFAKQKEAKEANACFAKQKEAKEANACFAKQKEAKEANACFAKQKEAKEAVNVNVDVNVDNNIILTDNSTDNKQNNIIEKKEIKNISKYNSTSNNDIFLISKKEEEKDWRKDFNVYLSELHEEVDKILCDAEWMEKQKEFNPPELNIIKTIECAIENFWGTTEGWENKKKSKTKKINWKTTLAKALKIQTNRVFYPKNLAGGARGFAKKETMEEQTQRVAFKIMQDIQEGKDDSLFGMMYNKKDNK
jgi:hypothetical protein